MILIALGGNLAGPDGNSPLHSCRAAAARLSALPGLRMVATSRWYRTAPVPASDQPDYINGVVALAGVADPPLLLAWLHAMETAAGRERHHPNAARTLDLDIIDLNGLVRDGPDPVLPHPRAHLRGFVLHPVRDVAPNWLHPRLGQTVDELIKNLPPEPIRVELSGS